MLCLCPLPFVAFIFSVSFVSVRKGAFHGGAGRPVFQWVHFSVIDILHILRPITASPPVTFRWTSHDCFSWRFAYSVLQLLGFRTKMRVWPTSSNLHWQIFYFSSFFLFDVCLFGCTSQSVYSLFNLRRCVFRSAFGGFLICGCSMSGNQLLTCTFT